MTERKASVFVPDVEFFPKYREALANNVKLADFAVQIGQAEQTIVQRIAKWNKQALSYKDTYDKMGVEVPKLGYLSQATGATRGRKSHKFTPVEMLEMFGIKLNSPV